jgi:hypothetical protein
MSQRASGTFEVKLDRQPPFDSADGVSLGRTTITKQFHGDLTGTSQGEMLSAGSSEVPGSAGYVAIERVRGTLHGRSGSFVLQHNGLLDRGRPELSVNVVPDSGSGELKGLRGSLTIDIREGKHYYSFEYALGEAG